MTFLIKKGVFMSKLFEDKKKVSEIRKNVNTKSPSSSNFVQENLQSLRPGIYDRLVKLYEKDFIVFGYKLPSFEEIKNGYIF